MSDAQGEPPLKYGDLRVTTERDNGKCCLFWVRDAELCDDLPARAQWRVCL